MLISLLDVSCFVTVVIAVCCLIRESTGEFKLSAARIKTALRKSGIVPDIIDIYPKYVLQVVYENNKEVAFGNNMTRWDTYEDPVHISYPADEKSYYTLIMTDPDCPSRENPEHREWQHWILVNIPGLNWKEGFYLTDYIGILGYYEFAVHRYVFILYKQPEKHKINFTERVLDVRPVERLRYKFSTKNFAAKYKMGAPIAINYFMSGKVPKTTTPTPETTTATATTATTTATTTTTTTTLRPAVAEAVVPPEAIPQDDAEVAAGGLA